MATTTCCRGQRRVVANRSRWRSRGTAACSTSSSPRWVTAWRAVPRGGCFESTRPGAGLRPSRPARCRRAARSRRTSRRTDRRPWSGQRTTRRTRWSSTSAGDPWRGCPDRPGTHALSTTEHCPRAAPFFGRTERSPSSTGPAPSSRSSSRSGSEVADVALAPDGTWGVTVGAAGVVLWDVDRSTGLWSERETLVGHAGDVLSAEIDPSGERLVTVSADNTIIVWDVRPNGGFGTAQPGLGGRWPAGARRRRAGAVGSRAHAGDARRREGPLRGTTHWAWLPPSSIPAAERSSSTYRWGTRCRMRYRGASASVSPDGRLDRGHLRPGHHRAGRAHAGSGRAHPAPPERRRKGSTGSRIRRASCAVPSGHPTVHDCSWAPGATSPGGSRPVPSPREGSRSWTPGRGEWSSRCSWSLPRRPCSSTTGVAGSR